MKCGKLIAGFGVLLLAGSLTACKNSRKAAGGETGTAEATPRAAAVAPAESAADAEPRQPEKEGQKKDQGRPKPEYPDSLFLRIHRTPCFGQCPVYRVDVYRSGRAYLEGERFFVYEGTFKTRFTEAEMAQIVKLAEQYNYFSFDHVYDAPVTDLPSTTTILRTEEKEHWVYNRMNSPDELRAFERELEAIIKAREWQPYIKEGKD